MNFNLQLFFFLNSKIQNGCHTTAPKSKQKLCGASQAPLIPLSYVLSNQVCNSAYAHISQNMVGKCYPNPPIPLVFREEASCWVTAEQSPFVLGLASENGELLLDECVQVTEGSKTKDIHLFLFRDVIVFAKLK